MQIYVSHNESAETFKVDFVSEMIVPTPELHLLTYRPNEERWIINNGKKPDVKTSAYSEYNLRRIQHIIYGHFFHNEEQISARLACCIDEEGFTGFYSVLFPIDIDGIGYSTTSAYNSDEKHFIIDFEYFNATRKLLGQEEMTLVEYISSRIPGIIHKEYDGVTLNDETSIFSVDPIRLDPNNYMSAKGMKIFIEEQNKEA